MVDENGSGYQGRMNITATGTACAHWSHVATYLAMNPFHFQDVDLKTAENFCRNPNGVLKKPWCYTDMTGLSWEYCFIEQCRK